MKCDVERTFPFDFCLFLITITTQEVCDWICILREIAKFSLTYCMQLAIIESVEGARRFLFVFEKCSNQANWLESFAPYTFQTNYCVKYRENYKKLLAQM